MEELSGATGFPQQLEERFPAVQGLLLDVEGRALRVTAAEAAVLGHDVALFVGADSRMALLFAELGPPALMEDRRR